jgi:hypothetical protein
MFLQELEWVTYLKVTVEPPKTSLSTRTVLSVICCNLALYSVFRYPFVPRYR